MSMHCKQPVIEFKFPRLSFQFTLIITRFVCIFIRASEMMVAITTRGIQDERLWRVPIPDLGLLARTPPQCTVRTIIPGKNIP